MIFTTALLEFMKYRMQRLRLLLNKILMTIFNLHFYYTILHVLFTYNFTTRFYMLHVNLHFYYTILHVIFNKRTQHYSVVWVNNCKLQKSSTFYCSVRNLFSSLKQLFNRRCGVKWQIQTLDALLEFKKTFSIFFFQKNTTTILRLIFFLFANEDMPLI